MQDNKISEASIPDEPSIKTEREISMQQVEAIITAHLRKPLPSLEEISRTLGISPATLKRSFKAQYGMPVYDYYSLARMQLAKKMLENADNPVLVKDIATFLGYADVSNLNHMFRKFYKKSPSMYQREYHETSKLKI